MTTKSQQDLERGEQIFKDRVRTEHLLRCLVQGHHGNPCRYCGHEWVMVAEVEPRDAA